MVRNLEEKKSVLWVIDWLGLKQTNKHHRGDTSKEMILSQKTCQEQQISITYRIFSENKVNMVGFF